MISQPLKTLPCPRPCPINIVSELFVEGLFRVRARARAGDFWG